MKKFLAIILCAIMILPAISITAGAETYNDLTYEKYDDHIEITGCDENATSVDIPAEIDGLPVTEIGGDAFKGCKSLTRVTIPDSIIWIGPESFYGCTGLTSVTIPHSVTDISYWAFYGCIGLKSITIGSGVTSISFNAFSECRSLNITVDENNTNYCDIDGVLFNKEKTEIIIYAKDMIQHEYSIPKGVISIDDSAFDSCTGLTSITVPDSVTGIGGHAFYGCKGLISVIIPDSVIEIGDLAFYGCSDLAIIKIGKGVTSIGEGAFSKTSYYNNKENWQNGVLYIDDCLVEANTDELPSNYTINSGTRLIADYAFPWCENLERITIPSGVISIGELAFLDCTGLTIVNVPDSVTWIGNYAFHNTAYYNEDSNWQNGVLYIDDCLIEANTDELPSNYTINSGTRLIADYAFDGCDNLTSVTIPSSVISIGECSFEGCSSLMNVTIPDSVTSIGDYAFNGCDNLTSVTIPSRVTSIGEGVFFSCDSLTNVTIPSSVTSIGESAFFSCDSLTSVTIPDSVKSIGDFAFDGCFGLTDVYYGGSEADWQKIDMGDDNENLTYATIHYGGEELPDPDIDYSDYLTYENYFDHIEITGCDANAVSVDIPAEIDGLPVTSIGDDAFSFHDNLTSVIIPISVTSIGYGAFWECSSLTNITIGTGVTNICGAAFGYTAYYKDKSNWQDGVLYIDNCLIEANSDELPSDYAINNGTRIIADDAFMFCGNLTSITLPNSVTSIGSSAFSYCKKLQNIVIPSGVTSIGEYAFSDCTALESVIISEGVTWVGDKLFDGCVSLRNVSLPSTLKNISDCMFGGCTALKSVDIPEGTETIADVAFFGCTNLEKINIPSTVNKIGDEAFPSAGKLSFNVSDKNKDFSSDDGVLFNKNKTKIIRYAKDKLQKKYQIPDGVINIAAAAFYGCSELTDLYIPASVSGYGSPSFSHCGKLRITVDSNNPKLSSQDGILYNKDKSTLICCANDIYTSFEIPDTVTQISWSAFSSCTNLKAIYVPISVKIIGAFVFDDCSDIYYAGSQEQWSDIVISGYGNPIKATIHYNSEGLPRIEVSEPVVEGGSITITAETKSIDGESELFVVGYDGGKLTASEKLQDGAATLPAEDVKTIKVFCWDSLDTMRPLCEPKTITIK